MATAWEGKTFEQECSDAEKEAARVRRLEDENSWNHRLELRRMGAMRRTLTAAYEAYYEATARLESYASDILARVKDKERITGVSAYQPDPVLHYRDCLKRLDKTLDFVRAVMFVSDYDEEALADLVKDAEDAAAKIVPPTWAR